MSRLAEISRGLLLSSFGALVSWFINTLTYSRCVFHHPSRSSVTRDTENTEKSLFSLAPERGASEKQLNGSAAGIDGPEGLAGFTFRPLNGK